MSKNMPVTSGHNRILVWGDPHYKRDNLEEMQAIGNFLVETVKQYRPDLLVCLGDVMDTHERCYTGPFNAAHDLFSELTSLVKVVTLVGNHDRPDNQEYMTQKHFLRGLPGHVVWHSQIDQHDNRIMYVPYVPPGRFSEAIADVWHPGVTVCFAHQEFRGASDNFHVSECTEEADPRMLIISGHYHKFQVIGNLIYVGTIQHRFSDCADNALMLFDMNENTYERIPINCIRKKITVEYSIDDISQAEEFVKQNSSAYDIRVNITVPYGHPTDMKDPRIQGIVKNSRSVVFHRAVETVSDTTTVVPALTLPDYREVFNSNLTEEQRNTAKEIGLII